MTKRKKAITMILIATILAGCGTISEEDHSKIEGTTEGLTGREDGTTSEDGKETAVGENTTEVKKLTAEEAYERMNSGDSLVVVDVRTAEEYAAGHIEGAILIPNEDIADAKPELLPVEDAEILIYCRSGNRSAQAAAKLLAMGYTNVSDFGGILDWPYETVEEEWQSKEGTFSSFRASDIEGNIWDESIFEGAELTMINVWATYCGPCLREMPDLGELSTEYENQGVQILGVVVDTLGQDGTIVQSQVEQARSLAEQTKAGYTHLLPSEDLLQAGLESIYSVPTTFFVDKEGNILGQPYLGAQDKDSWAAIIEEKLAEME